MKIGTFFSGVGSPEQALRNLGVKHEIEFACDIDKYAKETYLKNFKPKLFAEDITTLDMKNLPYVDLLVFGFPCQAFSMAGKRKGFDDTRGTLFYDALRYLREHKPRYFIAENVRGLVSHDNGKTFGTIIDCLAKTTNYQMSLMPFDNLGYHIHYKVLNTKDYGLPQNRERVFIIGIRDDKDNKFSFPKEIPLKLKLKDILQDNPNDKYYLSEKHHKEVIKSTFQGDRVHKLNENMSCLSAQGGNKLRGIGIEVDEKYYLSDKAIARCERSQVNKSLSKKGLDEISRTLIAGYYKGPFDGQYVKVDEKYYLSEEQQKRLLERTEVDIENVDEPTCLDVYNKKLVKDTSICLRTHNDFRLVPETKDKNIRRLTPIECERLQGFPDNFTAGVSDTQRYKQMGNTISVPVIQAIIKKLIV